MTMVAATEELENAVAVALQETQTAQPTQTVTHTATLTATVMATAQPSTVPSSTPTKSAQVIEADKQTSTEKNSESSESRVLIDEIGAIMVEVPIEWSDVDLTPVTLDCETEVPAISMSSSVPMKQ